MTRHVGHMAVCVLGLLAASAGIATPAEQISRTTYIAALRATESFLRAGHVDSAADVAEFLSGARVVDGSGEIGTDQWLLAPILADAPFDHAAQAERIAATVRALEEDGAPAGAAPDDVLLARIAQSQRPRTLPRGGTAGAMPLDPILPESVFTRIAKAWRALMDWIADWLVRMWPRPRGEKAEGGVTGPVIALMAGVVAALLFAAVRTLRRTARAPDMDAPAVLESARDEDPLAREVSDWEKRAAELARAGRYREAIRASYHAVLALLFRSGRLHYEKGRTNWEYAERVPPDAGWRRGFVELVRGFEREWYGHDQSSAEAWTASSAHSRRLLESLAARGER